MALSTQSSLQLSEMRSLVSFLMQDEDTTNPAFTTAQKNSELNDVWMRWHENFSDRLVFLTGTQAFGGALSPSTSAATSSATSYVLDWVHAYQSSTDVVPSATSIELEIISPPKLIQLQVAYPATGTPSSVSFERIGTITSASVGLWRMRWWPINSGTLYLCSAVRQNPFTTDVDGDRFDCTEIESRIIASIAAANLATRIGRNPTLIEGIWHQVPQDIQAVFRMNPAASAPVSGSRGRN